MLRKAVIAYGMLGAAAVGQIIGFTAGKHKAVTAVFAAFLVAVLAVRLGVTP